MKNVKEKKILVLANLKENEIYQKIPLYILFKPFLYDISI